MQPDELKQLWNRSNDAADAQEAFALDAWRSHRQRAVQHQLGAFSLWQWLQLAIWLAVAVYCGSQWWQQPPLAVMLSALSLHAYCIAAIIVSITRLQRRRQLHPTHTVLEQSHHLATLRWHTALTELLLGLPWCWLWLAVPVLVAWQAWRVDLGAVAAPWLLVSLGAGTLAMIAAMVAARRWVRRAPTSPRLQRAIDVLSGHRLARARAELEALRGWESA
jgi:hypothetical protein